MVEIPQSWYISTELHREITTWEDLTICFNHTIIFTNTNLVVHSALQHVHDVFLKVVLVVYLMDPHARCLIELMMECYNVTRGLDDGEDL